MAEYNYHSLIYNSSKYKDNCFVSEDTVVFSDTSKVTLKKDNIKNFLSTLKNRRFLSDFAIWIRKNKYQYNNIQEFNKLIKEFQH